MRGRARASANAVMSGLDATAEIRARERATGRHIPIVAMTAHATEGDQSRCLAAGVDGYLSKPFSLDALRRALAEVTAAPCVADGLALVGASRQNRPPAIQLATNAIRELIEAILLEPDGEQLKITLKGDLAGMLGAARDSKKSPDTGDSWSTFRWLRGRATAHAPGSRIYFRLARKNARSAGQACSEAFMLAPSWPFCWRRKPCPAPS